MAYEYIRVEEHDGVLVITMDDPKVRNAIGPEMQNELNTELARLDASPKLRCLVLTGKDPSFCSGANVRGMARRIEKQEQAPERPASLPSRPWDAVEQRLKRASPDPELESFPPMTLHRLQKPSIAAVNGYAMGLGTGLALSCDIRIASERAGFSETFIQRGLIPADGSCWQLPRMIGLSDTFLMQYTGDVIDASTALRLGLVSKVVPHERLMEEAVALAQRLASSATYSAGLIKWLVHRSLQVSFEEAMHLGRVAQTVARDTHDHREGVQSFIEKRKPQFQGK